MSMNGDSAKIMARETKYNQCPIIALTFTAKINNVDAVSQITPVSPLLITCIKGSCMKCFVNANAEMLGNGHAVI